MRFHAYFVVVACSATMVSAAEFELNGHKFTLPDGFVVEHVAGQPLVDRPVSADFDEYGRLYVTDSSGSNEPVKVQREKQPHRIRRLKDTDGDGRFEKSTVFVDKLMFPEGSQWFDGSLYVAAPPETICMGPTWDRTAGCTGVKVLSPSRGTSVRARNRGRRRPLTSFAADRRAGQSSP